MGKNILSKEVILDFLRKNKSFFKKEYDVDELILFGSYARDEATAESDVDILIESNTKSFDALCEMKKLLEDEFGKKVDIFYRDGVRTFIMRYIKKDFIKVYNSPNTFAK